MEENVKETQAPNVEDKMMGSPRDAIFFKIGVLKGLASSNEDSDVIGVLTECQQIYTDILRGRLRFVPDAPTEDGPVKEADDGGSKEE